MPALIKSALQRIQEAVEAARAGHGTQQLPADALYEAWQSPYGSKELLSSHYMPDDAITHSPLAQWLRQQNIGVRAEGPASFDSLRHYDATGGRQSLDAPVNWQFAAEYGGPEPTSVRWRLGELPTNIRSPLYREDPNMGGGPRVRGPFAYINEGEGGAQMELIDYAQADQIAASRSWSDMLRDPELRLRANMSYALPRSNPWHTRPLIKAKKDGGSV